MFVHKFCLFLNLIGSIYPYLTLMCRTFKMEHDSEKFLWAWFIFDNRCGLLYNHSYNEYTFLVEGDDDKANAQYLAFCVEEPRWGDIPQWMWETVPAYHTLNRYKILFI